MASVDRQQHALEVLKCINKAITNLRLYSDQSAQAINATEKAYAELKLFLRLYKTFCFGLCDGVPTLEGITFDRKGREQLDALTLVDTLAKSGFEGLTLNQGMDRKRLKQLLSFFVATPEQIQKAGGNKAFIQLADLNDIFCVLGGTDKVLSTPCFCLRTFANCLQQNIAEGVRQEEISSFLHTRSGGQQDEAAQKVLRDQVKGVRFFSAAICSALQPLQQERLYEISPTFNHLLDSVSLALTAEERQKMADGAAAGLVGQLDHESLSLLFCQRFDSPFATALFSSLVAAIDKERFRALIDFLRQEGEKLSLSPRPKAAEARLLVDGCCRKLMETVKGRQLHALESMGMTEIQRQTKRLQAGLSALAQGSLEGLRNKEILLYLSVAFGQLMANKKENVAAAIIQTLVGGLKLEDAELRDRCGQGLGLIGEKLVALACWSWLEKLTPTFLHWLRNADEVDDSWIRVVAVLQEILVHAQKTRKEELVEKILSFFYAIRSGALKKSAEARKQVGLIQDKAVDREVLQAYLEQCFIKPIEEMHCQKIIMSGPLGIQFLLDALLANTKRSERIKLLQILNSVGASLTPLLLERLQSPMPWYGKRNLLRLLSGTGDEKDIKAVHGYLSHEDLRVQSEALSCIQRLSEKKRKQELLEALPRISEKLKFHVVRALASVVDEEVVGALVELLKDERYFSADIKTTLLVSICHALGRSGSLHAQKALQAYIGKDDVRPKNMAEQVWRAAHRGLEVIEASLRERKRKNVELQQRSVVSGRSGQSVLDGAAKEYTPVTDLAEELEVYVLLSQNRLTAAKSLLLDLISTMSYLHRFDKAEALCHRLVEIDALALEDIVHATEIVEEQKILSVEQEQGMRWTDVYDFLTTEEFNCLYSVMEHVTYTADENIVVHGDQQQLLFFINKGRAKLFYQDRRGNEILLKTVGTGEILGADSFFKASAWTVNAASVGTVDAFVLHREALRKCKNACPELEAKLESFCQQLGEHDSLKVTAINRRMQKRYPVSSPLLMDLLDDDGKVTGTGLQGQTVDVSIGGISFMIRIKNIRQFLGRQVHVSLPDGPSECPLTTGVRGIVMAIYVQSTLKEGAAVHVPCSVHVQFDQPLLEAELALIASVE